MVLLGLLALCLLVGMEAARFTWDGVPGWYDSLARPALSPPDWLFGPVWAVLYVMMAVAATAMAFWRLDRRAGYLLLPYLAWLGFASYLNAGFWWLNHG